MPERNHCGWGKCFFAWAMIYAMKPYEHWIVKRKRRLFKMVSGKVLEIGPGSGTNLIYFSKGIQWTGIEPNIFFHRHITEKANKLGRKIILKKGRAEKLSLTDSSVDAVIGTLVLCSVSELQLVLLEIIRVLKPGGRFYFIEHVAAPTGSWLSLLQGGVRPAWQYLFDGCQSNAKTLEEIKAAGFSKVIYEEFQAPLPVVSRHISGFAEK